MARPDVYNPFAHRPKELVSKYNDDEIAQMWGDWKQFVISVARLMLWLGQTAAKQTANLPHSTRPQYSQRGGFEI